MAAVRYAREAGVPVVLTLGTRFVIDENPQWWRDFISENVTVLAMNEDEAEALTGIKDPLGAADKALDWADMVLCTAGPIGLYMASYTDEDYKRETTHTLLPGVIPEFNMYEFSRPMARDKCRKPARIYSHISPTWAARRRSRTPTGRGRALSAVLHDMVANAYHRMNVPNSAKHLSEFLTYSSLAQGVQVRQPGELRGAGPEQPAPLPRVAGEGRQPGRGVLGAVIPLPVDTRKGATGHPFLFLGLDHVLASLLLTSWTARVAAAYLVLRICSCCGARVC